MQKEELDKFFSVETESPEQVEAIAKARHAVRDCAETIDSLLMDTPDKASALQQLFAVKQAAEMSIRTHGPRKIYSPIVMVKQ